MTADRSQDFARTMDRRAFLRAAALVGAVAAGSQLVTPIAASAAPGLGAADPVRGVHLSFTGDPTTTLTAVWFTYGALDPGSTVQWVQLATGQTTATAAALTASAAGFSTALPFGSGLAHEATLTGLLPGRQVAYRVGSAAAWSEVFTAATLPGGDTAFRFAHYGDQGTDTAAARRTGPSVLATSPLFCLIAGDISYASEYTAPAQHLWDDWFDLVQPMTATVPIMCAMGNHDSESTTLLSSPVEETGDLTQESTETYLTRFAHPTNGGGRAELRYSFDAGRVHVLSLEASESFNPQDAAAELAFVQSDLAQAYAKRQAGLLDFIVVVQHFPIWCNESDRAPGDQTLQAVQDPVFQQYAVDLLLVGHNHQYERSYPMVLGQVRGADERPDPDGGPEYGPARQGYVQVINGGGGRDLYDFLPDDQIAAWSAVRAKAYAVTTVDYRPTSATRSALLRVTSHDTGTSAALPGPVIDQFTLARRTTLLTPAPTADPTPGATLPEAPLPVLLPVAGAALAAAVLAGRAQRAARVEKEC